MAILAAELKLYRSKVVTSTSANGGRMSGTVEVVNNVKNGSFPDVTDAQRIAGLTDHRKEFFHVENDADEVATNNLHFLSDISPSTGTRITLFEGTQRDTQGDLSGTERKYGPGRLNADEAAAQTVIVVDAEPGGGGAGDDIFQAGDKLWISDGTNEETVTIDTGGVSWSTDQATITLTTGLLNAYAAATPTVIASCIETTTITTTFDNWVETSTSGTYDEGGSPPTLDNIGTVDETWTLTFTDATNFGVVGDTLGSVGTGTTAGNFAPNNPDKTKPYLTLLSAGWAGTWANGETIVWQTHPASKPLWKKRDVDAGAPAGADEVEVAMIVES